VVNFSIEPSKTALLVTDMQNCFVEGYPISAPNGPRVLERLNRLVEACHNTGVQVIYTAHVVRPDGSNVGIMGEIIPPVRQGVINDGSESAALHRGIKLRKGDIFLKKPRFGAFHGTDLELILRSMCIDTIIIGGIATNVCCETTAREANARDLKVIFLSDGTATFGLPDLGYGTISSEEIQKAVCTTLAFAFAQVLTVDQVIEKISALSKHH
jgi:nicotinamidase-related amidase